MGASQCVGPDDPWGGGSLRPRSRSAGRHGDDQIPARSVRSPRRGASCRRRAGAEPRFPHRARAARASSFRGRPRPVGRSRRCHADRQRPLRSASRAGGGACPRLAAADDDRGAVRAFSDPDRRGADQSRRDRHLPVLRPILRPSRLGGPRDPARPLLAAAAVQPATGPPSMRSPLRCSSSSCSTRRRPTPWRRSPSSVFCCSTQAAAAGPRRRWR